jgi:hypothetical protein
MSQFNASYAQQAMTKCLRQGESLLAFAEAQDVGGMPKSGMWADAGTTWIGLTSSRLMEVPSANGEVISTKWTDVSRLEAKSGLMGGRFGFANSTWPDDLTEFKVDKGFAKQAQAIWQGEKTALAAGSTTASLRGYEGA